MDFNAYLQAQEAFAKVSGWIAKGEQFAKWNTKIPNGFKKLNAKTSPLNANSLTAESNK